MKQVKLNDHNLMKNNKGSTLITVIVAIAFVTILTTIILGTTLVNVRMKGIDKRTKDDFYYAEKALNDIYTGVGQELALVAGDEYEKAFEKVGNVETEAGEGGAVVVKADYNIAETAEKEFRKNFLHAVHEKFPSSPADLKSKLQKYITSTARNEAVDSVAAIEYQKKDGTSCTESEAYRVALRGVHVSATDSTGFRSVVSTDIIFNVPSVDFLGTNADVTDYGLIANEGLYIEGGGTTTINGNVYAGVHKNELTIDTPYKEKTDANSRQNFFGGININGTNAKFNGNYIVSKGDITLAGTNPTLSVYTPSAEGDANLANLWFSSLRTVSSATLPALPASIPAEGPSPTIDLNANIFALNDMTFNADNSCAKIKGNYYGYNDKTLPTANILGLKTGREDGESSAIIINGSDAYLDMKEINNFVLMGKAYIDFSSDASTDTTLTTTQVVPTAESVALKTNQQLYLVPPDFLDGANPTTDGTGTFNITIPASDLQKWFGYPYLNATKIDQPYTVTLNDASHTKVYYDYLVFNDTMSWKAELDGHGKAIKNADYTDKYTAVPITETTPLGKGGSISSKTKFFYDIMTSKEAYIEAFKHDSSYNPSKTIEQQKAAFDAFVETKEEDKVQPSAYRLYERINRSMGFEYFDLKKCVIGGGSEEAHYYARNAVINYEKSGSDFQCNVFNNTDGMLRYANYPQNLFHRYIWLCTRLNGNEDVPLGSAPAAPDLNDSTTEWKVSYDDSKKAAPICHFVKVDNLGSMSISDSVSKAESDGLKTTSFGVCIAQNSDLDLGSVPAAALVSGNFKGIAIVDGNITVPQNMKVYGLLMATGTITLKGNNEINYNKGLIQSRIEKEMNVVKNKKSDTPDTYKGKKGYTDYYVISYLSKDSGGSPQLIYDVDVASKVKSERIEADYNDFMHYENWQKGE